MTPGFLHPNNYTVVEMVTVLLMVVLGGIGHIWGGIIGAILVTIIYDLTRDYYQYQLLIFGLVIVLTVMFLPTGIGGIIDRYLVTRGFVALRKAKRNAA
jgi:branched-chain amino acid transport system permease protein